MKVYPSDKIRNVALLGHSGSGKTSLVEAMLHATGATNRLGRVEDGTTVSDWDEEEIARTQSINLSVVPCEWKDHKLNIIDTPGYPDFVGEVISALRVTEAGMVVLDAVAGVEVGTELAWQYLDHLNRPRLVFINKMDRDNASFERSLNNLREMFDGNFVPVQLPIGAESDFAGVVSVLEEKAYLGADAKPSDVPADMMDALEEAKFALVEAAAESDDELLMKYLEGETLTPEEVASGLAIAIREGTVIPVLCGAATREIGIRPLLDALIQLVPSPVEAAPYKALKGEEEIELPGETSGPVAALVFKTIADPFVGRITIFRVFNGSVPSDSRLFNVQKGVEERMGHTYVLRGKEQIAVNLVPAGDIAAVTKLSATATGDTLVDKEHKDLRIPPTEYPNPLYAVAVKPMTQADSAKISGALNRLCEEDPTLQWYNDPGTREMILAGMGDVHMTIAVNRLKNKFGVNVKTTVPKVPYRETVSRTATAAYRHKKQTGGAGQFAEVHMRVEPGEPGTELEYTWEVFGGAISSSFMPSIEKGIRSVMERGVLAGYPVVDVKVAVYDGKEHPVDSKDIAFQIAGREAFKKAFLEAGPVFLEPIYKVEIIVPEANMGDILGDLNTRRARVLGMNTVRGRSIITAEVPYAELLRYANDLRSMTQGRGIYSIEFLRYERVPQHLAQGIIDEAKRAEEED
ncbi:MAG: elongation factor G [Chloroflexi bacterium]|nr:elongation factor G [Chloroflexota bacterium]